MSNIITYDIVVLLLLQDEEQLLSLEQQLDLEILEHVSHKTSSDGITSFPASSLPYIITLFKIDLYVLGSANVWDSLAEGFLKAGDSEKAIELYNKALSLDPNGATGRNASMMLQRIAKGHH